MCRVIRIDDDVHNAAERLIKTYPANSRPSKQQLVNETLRAALGRRLMAAKAKPQPRQRKAG